MGELMKISQLIIDHLELYKGEIPQQTIEMISLLFDKYYKTEQLLFMVLESVGEVRVKEFIKAHTLADNENVEIKITDESWSGDTVIKLERSNPQP